MSSIFVSTFGTLGQHEFTFGFCGCTRSLAAGELAGQYIYTASGSVFSNE